MDTYIIAILYLVILNFGYYLGGIETVIVVVSALALGYLFEISDKE